MTFLFFLTVATICIHFLIVVSVPPSTTTVSTTTTADEPNENPFNTNETKDPVLKDRFNSETGEALNNREERATGPENVVNTLRSCVYTNNDLYRVIFLGDEVTRVTGKEKVVSHGSELKFGCDEIGVMRLVGPASAFCVDGEWQPKYFPYCSGSTAKQPVTIMIERPKRFIMRPGNVAIVEKNHPLYVICFQGARQQWPTLYHDHRNGRTIAEKRVSGKHGLIAYISIPNMVEEDSGTFTCYSDSDSYSVSVYVAESYGLTNSQCPRLHLTHGLSAQYVPQWYTIRRYTIVYFSCTDRTWDLKGVASMTCLKTGKWSADQPICIKSCRHPPPAIEWAEASVASGKHGTKVDYNCIPPYEIEVTGNQITCSHGEWIGKSPRCKDTRCHTTHLPYYHGIKAENKTVNDKEFYTPLCLDGYSSLDHKLECNKGIWKNLEQNPEFCKPDDCVVPRVANGDFYTYKEQQISIGYDALIQEKVDTGYVVKHNSTLYLVCQKGTLFQGRNETIGAKIKILCNSKQWVPKPDCWYSTSPTTTASITTAAPTTTARPTGNHLNSSKPLSSDEKYESVPNNNGNNINTLNSVKDCVYENSIPYLSVFFGGHIINAGIVPSGFEVKFACQPVGMLRLHGPVSVTCASGKWTPRNFPTCVLPTAEGEVALMFYSDVGYHVLPGSAVTVAKHTRVNIICYEVNQKKWPNLHHSDRNKNISAKKIISQEGLLYTIITIENMTEVYSGNYTCSSEIDSYTISVFVIGISSR